MSLFDIFKKNNPVSYQEIITQYQEFFEANKSLPLGYYGLIPYGEDTKSPFHVAPYDRALPVDFPFEAAFVWDELNDEQLIEEKMGVVQCGSIPIAREGCGIYWILITTGKHAGEVWLVTESGLTPIQEKMDLQTWKENQLKSNNTFWYPAVANWGPIQNAFFLTHAAKQMAAREVEVFGVSSSMCQSCLDYLSKCAVKYQKEYFVTDPEGTRIFGTDGNIETIGHDQSL
ncbi:hypothetical protein [Chitinophaga qingshengii]|uniref:Uncharacterized protein n=1 Tax=Chitinophaga qingshengii TaxID=1569794 RepID=A0ABR7TRY7_9BACT|nr:hypothetical protein [Chitinophaga qingshengii]MBC9932763.1 hypothetical protein [Chitinophaga qingshengii]